MPRSPDHQATSTSTSLPDAALQTGEPTHGISFWQACKVWVRIALQSFGAAGADTLRPAAPPLPTF